MTETRKQIIEIINPCMDKTLSEGCLVEYGEWCEPVILGQYEIKGDTVSRLYCPDDHGELERILGHYDTGAVGDFIYKNRKELKIKSPGIYFKQGQKIVERFILNKGFVKYVFPKKPLHLYTPQEEDNLLEFIT